MTREQIEREIEAIDRLQQADYRALQSRHRADMEALKERYDALLQPLVAMLPKAALAESVMRKVEAA